MVNFTSIEILNTDKKEVFQQAASLLFNNNFQLIDLDITRPWGFFLSVSESQAEHFIKIFYSGVDIKGIDPKLPLRPKLLGIAPNKRLSWQYHRRRSEIWRCIGGSFEAVSSQTDKETTPKTVNVGDVVAFGQGIRHRGVGKDNWSIVAEIWQHMNPENPSDEDDIIRLQDDFGRN